MNETPEHEKPTPLYTMGRKQGARKAIATAVQHLWQSGHTEAARYLEENAEAITKNATTGPDRDRWSSAYDGAIHRAEQATRDRTRAERDRAAGIDPTEE